jgi:hypothetical protein
VALRTLQPHAGPEQHHDYGTPLGASSLSPGQRGGFHGQTKTADRAGANCAGLRALPAGQAGCVATGRRALAARDQVRWLSHPGPRRGEPGALSHPQRVGLDRQVSRLGRGRRRLAGLHPRRRALRGERGGLFRLLGATLSPGRAGPEGRAGGLRLRHPVRGRRGSAVASSPPPARRASAPSSTRAAITSNTPCATSTKAPFRPGS